MADSPVSSNGKGSEQLAKEPGSSILSRFMGGALVVGLATMFTTVLGLVTTVVVVRSIPPGDFGAFVLLEVGYIFLAQVCSFGLMLAIPQFIASTEDKQYRGDLVKTVIYFRLLTVAVVGTIGLMVKPLLVRLIGSPVVLDLLIYTPLLFGLASLGKSFTCILQGLFRFRTIATIKLIGSGSYLILIAAFVLFLDQGVVGVVRARVISLVLTCAYAYFALPQVRERVFRFDILKKMLVFGLPLQLQYILTFAHNRIGTAGVAYYEVARKIPQSLTAFYEAFRVVYFPFATNLFALGKRQKLTDMLNHAIRWISFLTILGALITLLFGHEIVVLLFSESYLPSVPAFVLLMIGLNLVFMENTLGYSLVAIGDPVKPLIVNIARAVVSLLGSLLLIPAFGFVGAALATIAGNLASIPLDMIFLARKKIVAGIRDYLKPIMVFGVCALIFLSLGSSLGSFRIAIVGLYGMTCLFISAITVGDLAAVFKEVSTTLSGLVRRHRLKGTM